MDIYDSGNEKMTPATDIENEEASEDKIEYYINDEASSDEESNEKVIIDKPFSNEQMPQTSRILLNRCSFAGCKNIVYVSYKFFQTLKLTIFLYQLPKHMMN